MNIKSYLIKKQLESLRMILHFLLNFRKPTDKIVVSCSQQLDEVIVKYQKIQATLKKRLESSCISIGVKLHM